MVVDKAVKVLKNAIENLPFCPCCGENLELKDYVMGNVEYHYYKCPKCGTSVMISSKAGKEASRYIMVLNLSSTLK